MKKSTKAALLSAFVLPGAGHIYLKKYIPGVVLVCGSLGSIYYLTSKTVEKGLRIAEIIRSGDVQLDISAITELVSTQATGNETQLINIASAILIISWLIGIVDSYRVGRSQDCGAEAGVN